MFKMFTEYITNQRNAFTRELANDVRYWSLSASLYVYYITVKDIVKKYVHGKVLDAGAGRLNGRMLLIDYCDEYISLDVFNINGAIDIVGDIQNMVSIDDDSFDTVYSSQVLEHITKPSKALSEMQRVLKPGGYAIISVPHLNGLHEEPNDYYRFTPYGIRYLMLEAGFEIENQYRSGGLFCFLSHVMSLIVVSMFWPIPALKWIVWWVNKLLIVHPVLWLETVTKTSRKFPANLIIIGKKPERN